MLDTPIIVSDEKIKEGDNFYIIGGHPIKDGIRTCYWIDHRACWSEKNKNWTSETCNKLYIDKKEDAGWGFVEDYRSQKIIAGLLKLPQIDFNGFEEQLGVIDNYCTEVNKPKVFDIEVEMEDKGGYRKDSMNGFWISKLVPKITNNLIKIIRIL